jgi:hypothetical protein
MILKSLGSWKEFKNAKGIDYVSNLSTKEIALKMKELLNNDVTFLAEKSNITQNIKLISASLS